MKSFSRLDLVMEGSGRERCSAMLLQIASNPFGDLTRRGRLGEHGEEVGMKPFGSGQEVFSLAGTTVACWHYKSRCAKKT